MSKDEIDNYDIKSIYGVWYMKPLSLENFWNFQRDRECEWEQTFEFKDNGEFVDSYSAPCGNDGGIHHWRGKWEYNKERRVLFLQVENYPDRSGSVYAEYVNPSEGYKAGEEFFILELTEQRMRWQPKNPTVELYV